MQIEQYIAQSAQFENNSPEMIQRIAENPDLVHASMGIGDEFIEFMIEMEAAHNVEDDLGLFHEKVVKEAGDVLWYMAIACRKFNYNITTDVVISDKEPIISFAYAIQSILSAFKKYLIYGKELDHQSIEFWICIVCRYMQGMLGMPVEQIMERNYQKLSARYGDKYSDNAAINKDETKE